MVGENGGTDDCFFVDDTVDGRLVDVDLEQCRLVVY